MKKGGDLQFFLFFIFYFIGGGGGEGGGKHSAHSYAFLEAFLF